MNAINNTLPNEVSLEEYISLPVEIDTNNHRNNSFSILMDVWGEADHAMQMERTDKSRLKIQLKALHDICNILYSNVIFDDAIKTELMIAEWELNDYLLGSNRFGYSESGVMSWFDQWCYSINYDMLSLDTL